MGRVARFAISNAIGYCAAVGLPTVLDPTLESRAGFGARTYPLGNWIFLFVIAVLGLTCLIPFWGHRIIHRPIFRALAISSVCPFISLSTLYNFRPEMPHANVVLVSFWFALIIFLGAFVAEHEVDLGFVSDTQIAPEARADALRLEYDFWWKIAGIVATSYGLSLVYVWLGEKEFIELTFTDPKDQGDLLVGYTAVTVGNAIVFGLGFVWEVARKLSVIKSNRTCIS